MDTIPSSKVLDKISELTAKAKAAQTKEQQLGYILAVKALCELLERDIVTVNDSTVVAPPIAADTTADQAEHKMRFEDANGTSLLDF
ncbi:MAG: DUF5327 family protein [Bacillus sp. (in: firmicutes)]